MSPYAGTTRDVIEESVTSDGVFNTYTVTSNFGTWKIQSTSLAAQRAREVGAIAQLKQVDTKLSAEQKARPQWLEHSPLDGSFMELSLGRISYLIQK